MTVLDVIHPSTIADHLSKPFWMLSKYHMADKVLFCTKTISGFKSQSSGAVKENLPIAVYFEIIHLNTLSIRLPCKNLTRETWIVL